MDQVETKYANFKAFIKASVPESHRNHFLIGMLEMTPLSAFLLSIKEHIKENEKHILSDLLKKMDLTYMDLKKEDIEKGLLYIDYFKRAILVQSQ